MPTSIPLFCASRPFFETLPWCFVPLGLLAPLGWAGEKRINDDFLGIARQRKSPLADPILGSARELCRVDLAIGGLAIPFALAFFLFASLFLLAFLFPFGGGRQFAFLFVAEEFLGVFQELFAQLI